MKRTLFSLAIALLLMLCSNEMQAQNNQKQLNQEELVKRYIGTWKAELAKDTTIWFETSAYGEKAYLGSFKTRAKDKVIFETKQMWIYDKKSDTIIGIELEKQSGTLTYYLSRFISENIYKGTAIKDMMHPDIINQIFYEEFKSPDMFIQSFISNDQKVSITFKRIK